MIHGRYTTRRFAGIAVVLALCGTLPFHRLSSTQAAGGTAVYRGAAYGYTLPVPTSWVRVPNVHWTPAGPPADVTFMTPDHQAALSVLISPTGNQTYTDADLQGVARRLLYQENLVLTPTAIQTARIMIGKVAYESASIERASGEPEMLTLTTVAVTQQHHRLYALAGVEYQVVASLPPPGSSDPTPTPTPEVGDLTRLRQRVAPLARPTNVPSTGRVISDGRVGSDPADPPPPLPTDRLRGDPCPAPTDRALVVRDRNCAAPAERALLTSMEAGFTIDPRAPNDSRPAASITLDGYAPVTNRTLGVTVAFPAQWAPITLQGINYAVRSPDQNALDLLAVQSSPVANPSVSDLETIAANDVASVGTVTPGETTYQTGKTNGIVTVSANVPIVSIKRANFGVDYARVEVVVAADHGHIYSVLGTSITNSSAEGPPPVIYPFFSPFTVLARGYQTANDTRLMETGLALQAVTTLALH